MSSTGTQNLTIEITRGAYTWTAPARHVYDVETRRTGFWCNSSSHDDVEIAKTEARRQVNPRLWGKAREDVRIRRRLVVDARGFVSGQL